VPPKSRRQAHAIVFKLRANRKLTSETARLQRVRRSGGIDSAHAGVSNKPRATNAAKHSWIQNATKWLDRDEVRAREPRHPADVDSPVQTVPARAAHQGSADEAVDSPVAGLTKHRVDTTKLHYVTHAGERVPLAPSCCHPDMRIGNDKAACVSHSDRLSDEFYFSPPGHIQCGLYEAF
jgi:hypothetical protein